MARSIVAWIVSGPIFAFGDGLREGLVHSLTYEF